MMKFLAGVLVTLAFIGFLAWALPLRFYHDAMGEPDNVVLMLSVSHNPALKGRWRHRSGGQAFGLGVVNRTILECRDREDAERIAAEMTAMRP